MTARPGPTEVAAAGPSEARAEIGAGAAHRFRLGYRPQLDGLRAIAVVLVLLHHLGDLVVPGVIGWLAPGGYLGVDIFFVLSGFLITSLLLAEGERTGRILWGRFLLRRALRLLPALVFFLLALLVALPVLGLASLHELVSTAAYGLSYVQNWQFLSLTHVTEVNQTWSLAVEGQFYVVWSLVVVGLLALRARRGVVGLVAAMGILASASWRFYDYGTDHNWLRVYVSSPDRADSLLMGCLAAVAVTQGWLRGADGSDGERRRFRRVQRAWQGVQALALLALLVMAWTLIDDTAALYRGVFTVIAALAALVILGALFGGDGVVNRFLASPPAVALGKISYALYLWHYAVFVVLHDHGLTWGPGWRVGIAVVVPVALSIASYWCVELPFLRLKKRRAAAPGSVEVGHRGVAAAVR